MRGTTTAPRTRKEEWLGPQPQRRFDLSLRNPEPFASGALVQEQFYPEYRGGSGSIVSGLIQDFTEWAAANWPDIRTEFNPGSGVIAIQDIRDSPLFNPFFALTGSGGFQSYNQAFFALTGSGSFQSYNQAGLSESLTSILLTKARLISADLASRLQELIDLPEDWDGDHAKAIQLAAVEQTISLLKKLQQSHAAFCLPFIAPTFEGNLLLDWTSTQRTLEVESEAGSWSIVGTKMMNDGSKEYFSASTVQDETGMLEYYKWFCGDLQTWPPMQ